jgi:hypothetical protein
MKHVNNVNLHLPLCNGIQAKYHDLCLPVKKPDSEVKYLNNLFLSFQSTVGNFLILLIDISTKSIL